ncbi:hypothetical protein JD969_08360 [Planctomycetota bacterium]|nr:hypothetical protein JD969_08360 [Planctomycetota bacterium]
MTCVNPAFRIGSTALPLPNDWDNFDGLVLANSDEFQQQGKLPKLCQFTTLTVLKLENNSISLFLKMGEIV